MTITEITKEMHKLSVEDRSNALMFLLGSLKGHESKGFLAEEIAEVLKEFLEKENP